MDLVPLYAIIYMLAPAMIMAILCIFVKGPVVYIISKYSNESKRGNHNLKAHCRFYGSIATLTILLVGLVFISRDYSIRWLFWVSLVALPIPAIVNYIYIRTGERFKK
jgi:hypothetical protein